VGTIAREDRAYVLTGVDQKQKLLVIRSEDIDLLRTIIKKIGKIRNPVAKRMAEILERDLSE
jgi:hypothetical protein